MISPDFRLSLFSDGSFREVEPENHILPQIPVLVKSRSSGVFLEAARRKKIMKY